MAEITQEEADALLKYPKICVIANDIDFPTQKKPRLQIKLCSQDGLYKFTLDINRSSLNLYKITYQNRYPQNIILARLDLNGAGHRNPDDTEVSGSHLHLYREGYGDKFAIELPQQFDNIDRNDLEKILVAFMKYCNIIKFPKFNYKYETGMLL